MQLAHSVTGSKECSCTAGRWCNQLDPNVNRAAFTHWEDAVIIRAWQVRLCCPHLLTPAHHHAMASDTLQQGSRPQVLSSANATLLLL